MTLTRHAVTVDKIQLYLSHRSAAGRDTVNNTLGRPHNHRRQLATTTITIRRQDTHGTTLCISSDEEDYEKDAAASAAAAAGATSTPYCLSIVRISGRRLSEAVQVVAAITGRAAYRNYYFPADCSANSAALMAWLNAQRDLTTSPRSTVVTFKMRDADCCATVHAQPTRVAYVGVSITNPRH